MDGLREWGGSSNYLGVYFFGEVHCVACGILVPQPGIKPVPPTVETSEPPRKSV